MSGLPPLNFTETPKVTNVNNTNSGNAPPIDSSTVEKVVQRKLSSQDIFHHAHPELLHFEKLPERIRNELDRGIKRRLSSEKENVSTFLSMNQDSKPFAIEQGGGIFEIGLAVKHQKLEQTESTPSSFIEPSSKTAPMNQNVSKDTSMSRLEKWMSREENVIWKLVPDLKLICDPSFITEVNVLTGMTEQGKHLFHTFYVHEFVLRNLSEVFARLFMHKGIETGFKGRVEIYGNEPRLLIHPQAMAQIIAFAYAKFGQIEKGSYPSLVDLKKTYSAKDFDRILEDFFSLCERNQIDELKKECLQFIQEEMGKPENIPHYLGWAFGESDVGLNRLEIWKQCLKELLLSERDPEKFFSILLNYAEFDYKECTKEMTDALFAILQENYEQKVMSLAEQPLGKRPGIYGPVYKAILNSLLPLYPHFDMPSFLVETIYEKFSQVKFGHHTFTPRMQNFLRNNLSNREKIALLLCEKILRNAEDEAPVNKMLKAELSSLTNEERVEYAEALSLLDIHFHMMFESVLKELWKKYPENKVLEQKLAHCRFIASYFELDEEDQEGIYQAIDDNFDAYVAILKQFPVNRGQWNDLSDELCAFYHDCSNPARFDQIIMHLTVIIESEPNDLAIRALRARYCIKKENWDAALEDLNFCLERMSPDKPSLVSQFAFALYNRAYCYSKKEQWDVAIRDLREAFSLADSSKQSDKIFKLIKDIEDKKKSS